MSRPIKLRAWSEAKGCFVPVTSWPLDGEELQIVQFTGKYDASGAEIWEGDILYWSYHDNSSNTLSEAWHQVIFQNGCFGIAESDGGNFEPFSNLNNGDVVAGNIFQHWHYLTPGAETTNRESTIRVSAGPKYYTLLASDIAYCRGDGHYAWVHTAEGKSFITCKTLAALAVQLPAFLRVHQSYLINPEYMTLLPPQGPRTRKVLLKNGNRIIIPCQSRFMARLLAS